MLIIIQAAGGAGEAFTAGCDYSAGDGGGDGTTFTYITIYVDDSGDVYSDVSGTGGGQQWGPPPCPPDDGGTGTNAINKRLNSVTSKKVNVVAPGGGSGCPTAPDGSDWMPVSLAKYNLTSAQQQWLYNNTGYFEAFFNYINSANLSDSDAIVFLNYCINYVMDDPTVSVYRILNQVGAMSPTDNIFTDMENPVNVADDQVVDLGITVSDVASNTSLGSFRTIAQTVDRRPSPPAIAEDMTYGTNGDVTGINKSELNLSDNILFNAMSSLFYKFTILDQSGLGVVGNSMIQKFQAKSGGQFSDPVLDGRVKASSEYKNFIEHVGSDINDALKKTNGDLNQVQAIALVYRPIFGGSYNKYHGLQILIHDTEYTEIKITNYQYFGNGVWTAILDITIHDDFGLDKQDALTYQSFLGFNTGFADWWILQHKRSYVPFETVVHLNAAIAAQF